MATEKINKGLRALAVGDALMDFQYWVERIPAPGQDVQILAYEENAGGSAANSAAGMAWLGIGSAFCGCIGNDANGSRVMSILEKAGVDTCLVQRTGSTGYVLSMIDPSGERTMFSYRGASEQTALTPALQTALAEAELVLMSGYMLANTVQAGFALELANTARQAGVLVALDASPAFGAIAPNIQQQALGLCDIFLPNRDELTMAGTGSWQENLEQLSHKIPCIAVKMGVEGAVLVLSDKFAAAHAPEHAAANRLVAPAVPCMPLDTTGAGDAFNAGFIAAFLQGLPPLQWLETGNRLASEVISVRGATGLYKNQPPRPL